MAANGTDYGPLTDLPDWSFVDGRIAPLWKGHVRRKEEREEFARRIVMLSEEVDKGIRTWEQKQKQTATEQEEKRRNLLNAKGGILQSKKAQ